MSRDLSGKDKTHQTYQKSIPPSAVSEFLRKCCEIISLHGLSCCRDPALCRCIQNGTVWATVTACTTLTVADAPVSGPFPVQFHPVSAWADGCAAPGCSVVLGCHPHPGRQVNALRVAGMWLCPALSLVAMFTVCPPAQHKSIRAYMRKQGARSIFMNNEQDAFVTCSDVFGSKNVVQVC